VVPSGSQAAQGNLTRAGRAFQKHSARGEFVRTSNSQRTFDQQGENLLNSIVTNSELVFA